jgi:hypothetical protein
LRIFRDILGNLIVILRNRMMKPLAIAFSGPGRELRGRYGEDDLINVQYLKLLQ